MPPKRYGWAVVTMIVCLAISLMAAAEALVPGWSGDTWLVGLGLTAMEAMYSFRVLRLPRSRGLSILRYRLAEACLLAIVLKGVTYMSYTPSAIEAEMLTMLRHPSALFPGHYVVLLVTAWCTWMIMNRTLEDIEALYDPYLSDTGHQAPREKLMARFYWGGGLMVLLIGATYFAADVSLTAWPSAPRTSGWHLNALIYFLLGTWLLSQIRLTSLMTGWRLQNISVAEGLSRSWLRYGLVFLILIALLTAALPTHDSMGLFDTALLGLKLLVDLVRRVMELLILAVTLPLSWLLRLLGHGEVGTLPLPPIPDTVVPAPEPKSRSFLPWEVVRAVAFWLTFLAVAVYLIRSYFEDHPELLEGLKNLTFARRLVEMLAALAALLAGWANKGLHWRPTFQSPSLAESETNPRAPKKRWRWGASRPRSERERIMHAYLHMLQHAAAAGVRRKAHQTPYEYAPQLSYALPDAERDINGLTDAFVHVRYGPEPADSGHAERAVAYGERVQKALQGLRQRDNTEG